MKAVLSNRIYLSVNKEQTNQLERELTYTIAPRIPSDPPIVTGKRVVSTCVVDFM